MPITAPSTAAAPVFVAVGHNGLRASSPDGLTWSAPQLGKDGEVYRQVAFGNGRFAAVGSYGGENLFAASADGSTWQAAKRDAKYVNYVRGLAFGNGTFLGLGGDPGSVGSSNPFALFSADGFAWSDPVKIAGKNILRRAAYGRGTWVGVGDRGRRSASKDAREWVDVAKVKAIDTLVDVAFGPTAGPDKQGLFVGVGLHGLRMTTPDGVAWSDRIPGEEGEHLNAVLWAREQFVAIGQGATYFSPDGLAWTRRPNQDAPLTAAFGNGRFVGANWKGRILVSDDAVTWRPTHKFEHHVEAIAFRDKPNESGSDATPR